MSEAQPAKETAPSDPPVEAGGLPVHEAPSKNALKKAQKEKEKAEKKAAAKRAEEEKRATAAEASSAEDTAKENYGALSEGAQIHNLKVLGDLKESDVENEVSLYARLHNSRPQGATLAFLMLRQRGKTIQAVVAAPKGTISPSRPMVKWCQGININSIVLVTGKAVKPEVPVASATLSTIELHVTKIYMISEAAEMIPLQPKDVERPPPEGAIQGQLAADGTPLVELNTRLNNRVIDLQSECNQAILSISSKTKLLFTKYMDDHGFIMVDTPKLLGAATEGGAGVFEVSNYFGKKAYLAQSPQLHKQMLIAGDCERVFEIGPVFRAENSNSPRHLTEFTGLDFEMVFPTHYHEVLSFAETLILDIIRTLQTTCSAEIASIQKSYPRAGDFRLPASGKPLRLPYLEAVKLLKDAGVDVSVQESFENDLTTAMEKQVGAIIREKYNTDFYTLDEFPMSVRPFYTKPHPTNPNLSNSYDLFMRGEEIMSGAQRINDVKELEAAMRVKGVDPASDGFKDYVDAFRQGCRPHAGGGLGLNRIVMFFLGLPNVRQATAFPRDPQRLRP